MGRFLDKGEDPGSNTCEPVGVGVLDTSSKESVSYIRK